MITEETIYSLNLEGIPVTGNIARLSSRQWNTMVEEILQKHWSVPDTRPEFVIKTVCEFYSITIGQMFSKYRTDEHVKRRYVLFKLLSEWPLSSGDIAKLCGSVSKTNIKQSTILWGLRTFESRRKMEPKIADEYAAIRTKVKHLLKGK